MTKTFYLGVEVLYSQLNSAPTGAALSSWYRAGAFALLRLRRRDCDRSAFIDWAFTLRAHRDFLP